MSKSGREICQLDIYVYTPDVIPNTLGVIISLQKSLHDYQKKKQLFTEAKSSKVAQSCQSFVLLK